MYKCCQSGKICHFQRQTPQKVGSTIYFCGITILAGKQTHGDKWTFTGYTQLFQVIYLYGQTYDQVVN